MIDHTRRAIEELDREGEGVWDVLPSITTPVLPVCRPYDSAAAAHAALTTAGFAPTGAAVVTPPLHPTYDLRTVLKYTDAAARAGTIPAAVVLARRTAGRS